MDTIQVSYTQARENLASLLDQVVADQGIVIIQRRNRPDVALLAASELSSLLETVYLLRSPTNAKRLLAALESSYTDDANPNPPGPHSLTALCKELGLERQEETTP